MTLDKILCLGVGFVFGVFASVVGFVCLMDWIDERDARKKEKRLRG